MAREPRNGSIDTAKFTVLYGYTFFFPWNYYKREEIRAELLISAKHVLSVFSTRSNACETELDDKQRNLHGLSIP